MITKAVNAPNLIDFLTVHLRVNLSQKTVPIISGLS